MGIAMLLMLAAGLPAAFAYNFQSGGIYYDITGSNTVAVTYATGSYNSYSGEVSIPSTVTYNGTHYTVTAIGNNAFCNCSNLTGVTIPGTVTSIGVSAFYSCGRLHSVTFPTNLTTIGEYAFYSCGRLHSVTFPTNLTTIGAYAFEGSGLYSVTIPAAVTSIGSKAFRQCSSLRSANFYASNCTSAPSIFYGCSHLDTLTIGSNVHNLPGSVFSNLSALKKVHIPNSVTSMGNNPFAYCPNLDTIVVAAGNSMFSSGNHSSYIVNTSTHTLVTGCKRTVIPNSVTHIGGAAFAGCTGLTGALTIPNQITIIGANAYSGCTGLTSLTIGHGVDSIRNSAFSSCSGISSVAFNADSCRYMYAVFSGCGSFSTLTIGNNVKTIPADAFYGCNRLTGMLVIPNSVKYIGASAFEGCNGLTSLSIGNSVTSIGSSTFYNCSNMGGTLTIPQSVKTIGSSAFYNCTNFSAIVFNADSCTNGSFSGCSNVTSLTIGNNVKVIPASAFSGLSQISGVLTIPNSVLTIGNNAFSNCSGLTGALTIPDSVLTIGNNAFSNCGGLTSLTIGNAVSTIGNNAFSNCTGLTSIVFNADSCVSIGGSSSSYSVFSGCTGPTTLTFGENVKVIPAYAFQGFTGLTGDLTIPNSVLTIGRSAFQNCSGLTSLAIGNTVSTIGYAAFSGCSALSGLLTIPNSTKVISDFAFQDCSVLDSLVIGKSVNSIGRYVFQGCSNISFIAFNADSCISMGFEDYNHFPVFPNCSLPLTLSIGNNVKYIPDYAFYGLNCLSGVVTIPDSVTQIGTAAFLGCSGLDSLNIGESITSIGSAAFKNCSELSFISFNAENCTSMNPGYYPETNAVFAGCTAPCSLKFGNIVKKIPDYAFYGLNGLFGTVSIPDSVTSIGSFAFANCSAFDSLIIPHRLTQIGASAFQNCNGLTYVDFKADSCVSMGDYYNYVFSGCTGAATLTIGNNVKLIPNNAFRSFSGLDTLIIGRSVDRIGSDAFNNCIGLTSIQFNADSCKVTDSPFSGCTNPATITIGDNVKHIPANIFDGYSGLSRTLIIPDSVFSIGSDAFRDCSGLDTIIIGRAVSSMGQRAFSYCSNLRTVIFNADSCTSMFSGSYYTNYDVFYGCDSLISLIIGSNVKIIPEYAFRGRNLSGKLIIPDALSYIGQYAFNGCTGLDSLVIGNAVAYIGQYAFYNCTGLTGTLYLPNVDTIGYRAFYNCGGINSLILGEGVKYIGGQSFYNCNSLTGMLNIPNSVTNIGGGAFYGCTSFGTLVIGRGVAAIGSDAFKNCIGLTYVTFNADSCTSIGQYNSDVGFAGDTNITYLSLGENVKIIPKNAFYGGNSTPLSKLSGKLEIPNSVIEIGQNAFKGCSGYDTLVIGRGVKIIHQYAFDGWSGLTTLFFNADSCESMLSTQSNGYYTSCFYNCANLVNLTLGNNVKFIPQLAFEDCSHLTGTIIIPDSLKTISSNAFNGCTGIDTLIIGKSVQSIGYNAFKDCTQLTKVNFNADSCITMMMGAGTSNISSYTVFNGCTNITSLNISNNVKNIPPYAFYGLNHITGTLTIPDSVVFIGGYAFNGCSGYSSLILGRSVDTIGQRAFPGNIASIYSYLETPPAVDKTSSYQTFYSVNRNTPVYVPCGSAQAYRNVWTYSSSNSSSYFYNVYENLLPYAFTAIPADSLQGTVHATTQGTCTEPAVIEATPNFFYVFDHWSDGNTDNPRTVALTQDTTLVAHFREYTLTIIPPSDTALGQVVVLQEPTAENPQAVVSVIPGRCYSFGSWASPANDWDPISYDNPMTLTLTQDTTIRAYFSSKVQVDISQSSDYICEGDSIIVTASGAESYMWTKAHWDYVEGRTIDDDTLGISDSIALTEGGYHYRVIGTDSTGCQGYYGLFSIDVYKYPPVIIAGKTEICEGHSTTLTVSSGGDYELTESLTNGIPYDWAISNNLQLYDLGGNHGNAILFPAYNLPENSSGDLLIPNVNLGFYDRRLTFDVAYRSYNWNCNEQLRVFISTVEDTSWVEVYSKTGNQLSNYNLYDSFYPNDSQWKHQSINLSNLFVNGNAKIKFVFSGGQGNNLWIDNIRVYSPYAEYFPYQYQWSNGSSDRQQTFDSTGVYSVTVSDHICSSTDSVTVTVWQPDTTELTVDAATTSYTLNGETFCTSGDYTQILQNIHGCDSVVNLHLTIQSDTTVIYDTLCAGSKMIQQVYMSPDEYQQMLMQWEYQFGDSLPFELSYDTITNILTVKGVFISIFVQWETGYDEYGYPTYNYFDTTLYLNYNVWKDSAYYDNFSYTITYPSSAGCDSTVTWHRKILFSDNAEYIVTACGYHIWQGDSLFGLNGNTGDYQIFHAGDTLTQPGEYAQVYKCKNGCDSVILLHLNIIPASYEEFSATACDSYIWNGITYTESGDYTLNSDTTLALVRNLYVNNWGEWGYDDADGNFIYLQPNGWSQLQVHTDYDSETGDYTYYYYYFDQNGAEHLYNLGDIVPYIDTVPGCKSATLHLTITQPTNGDTTAVACNSFTWHGNTYTQSGNYTHTMNNATGCDSVVTLHLTVTQPTTGDTTAVACESFTWHGHTYTQSGDYTYTATSATGCDSVVTLHLTILPLPIPNITGATTVCEGQTATLTATGGTSYLWEDGTTTSTYAATVSSLYTVTVTNAEGCSATASATVTVNPLPEVAITGSTAICPGGSTILTATGADSYMWSNGSTNASIPVNMFGQYSVIGTSAAGCFSTASVTVLVSQPPVITISGNTNLCAGESTTLAVTGGASYMWSNGSTDSSITVNTAGNWQVIGYNESNCSNMASVTVNVWQPASSDLYITSFDSCYVWFGTPRCESGNYTYALQTIHGCDSVITLHLTLEDAITNEFSATACNSYTWNGITYSQSGSYTQTFTAGNGNDSIVTLHLTIYPAKTAEIAETVCDIYEWNSQTYTSSGDYIQTFTAVNGCDSTVTLHLTVNHSTAGDTTAVACESFSWHGNTYTQSGNYTYTTTNAAGCDSVVTLHLTVNQPAAMTDSRTVCANELPIVWNGVPFAGAGTQTATLQTVNGCDSVVTMTLTVNQPTTAIDEHTVCGSFTWIDGNTYTASTNVPTFTLTNAAGCDSVVTLHLTVRQPTTGDTTAAVCGSFEWHGNTYTQSGNYTYTTTNAAGCDSVVTLHLTIQQPTTGDTTAVACESFTWYGNTYTESGDYTCVLSNAAGCDSVVTLHLTIHHTPVFNISGNLEINQGQSTMLSVPNNAGWTYLWNTGETASFIIASPSVTSTYSITVTEGSCSASDSVIVTVNTGLNDHEFGNLTVYPNPTTGIANVQFTDYQNPITKIHLYDAYGKLVAVVAVNNDGTTQIDLSRFASGVYFVKAMADGNVVAVRKVVKR